MPELPKSVKPLSVSKLLLFATAQVCADKLEYALSQGLKVIACVGETLEQREAGAKMEVVATQTKAIAGLIMNWDNIVVAYEPVWAIGTGKVAIPVQAHKEKENGFVEFRSSNEGNFWQDSSLHNRDKIECRA